MENQKTIEFHEAANQFPLLGEKELEELSKDIQDNGLREPIKLFDNKILDGRNRYLACQKIQIKPDFETLPISIDPFAYSWSLNGSRRDLAAGQKYAIWKSCTEKSEQWNLKQKQIQDEANKKRAEAAKERERDTKGAFKIINTPVVEQVEPLLVKPKVTETIKSEAIPKATAHKTREAKAQASGTNQATVQRVDTLQKKRPDLFEKLKTGDITESAAVRTMKKDENKEKLEAIQAIEPEQINKEYDVIVIDPPWDMKKINRDERPNQVDFDYPTMTEEQLEQLKIPTAENCHVWVWTTHKFLPTALRLIEKWKFKYVCTFTWHKSGGFQPIGLPQYNCEFAIYARKGTPEFFDTKSFFTCFNAARGVHSEKPKEFYDTVNRVTAGRKLDMFNRRKIEGFDGWGKEAK